MKAFEERYTAWVDGLLSPEEAAAFEAEFGGKCPEAIRDRDSISALGNFLRDHTAPPPMPNADFFRHQLMKEIEKETPRPHPVAAPASSPVPFWRFIWASAACAGVAVLLGVTLLAPGNPDAFNGYQAQILHARPGDSGISAVPFHSKKANVTVLWLDGLDYLPTLPKEGRP